MADSSIYEDIVLRTDGDIYLGVVGPVRTGKSTFIKRFMETLVLPNMDNIYKQERAKDELPQSGSGCTITTVEPKFVPEEAVTLNLEGVELSVRLIDCVGYMVPGATGQYENGVERMVSTPWFPEEVSMTVAAEEGTRKVIREHSTIGLVITTDGSICDIPRNDYVNAEDRVIRELQEIGKPFVLLVNSTNPKGEAAQQLALQLKERFGLTPLCVNCAQLDTRDITSILRAALGAFPLDALRFTLPAWVETLPMEHPIRKELYDAIRMSLRDAKRMADVDRLQSALTGGEQGREVRLQRLLLGQGSAEIEVILPQELYYQTISQQSGFPIRDDGDLMALLTELKGMKSEYDRISEALASVRETGYGVVMPAPEELKLEEPEIVRQGGRYGVRLKASAPSIHMMMANIETEVSPALGGEKASEEIINFLLQGFEGDTGRLWESNIFGKSLYDIASEGVMTKIRKMPTNARNKLQHSLQRIVNEGSGSLICIII